MRWLIATVLWDIDSVPRVMSTYSSAGQRCPRSKRSLGRLAIRFNVRKRTVEVVDDLAE
jgi:hypothetical protein